MMKHKTAKFWQPDDEELVQALTTGLEKNFQHVDVAIVSCPDLRGFGLASSGLSGSSALFEFGGEPYAHNPRYRGSRVNVDEMLQAAGPANAKILGAAMADTASINNNAGEMISNRDSQGANLSCVARVGSERECIVEPYPSSDCGPIANLYVSEGKQEDVLRIEVRCRTGAQASLTQSLRESLMSLTGSDRHIGMGGAFQLIQGRVKSHVMPNYDCLVEGYYDTAKEMVVKDFLQFYEHMGPDLLCLCTLWTGDPTGGDLNLRTSGEHTHFYHLDDNMQQAGHYHGDVTPDEVHYLGYFGLAQRIVRFGDIYEELGIKP
jgi:hypothetical protein